MRTRSGQHARRKRTSAPCQLQLCVSVCVFRNLQGSNSEGSGSECLQQHGTTPRAEADPENLEVSAVGFSSRFLPLWWPSSPLLPFNVRSLRAPIDSLQLRPRTLRKQDPDTFSKLVPGRVPFTRNTQPIQRVNNNGVKLALRKTRCSCDGSVSSYLRLANFYSSFVLAR